MRRWQTVLPLALGMFILEPIAADRLNAQTTESELGALVENISQVEHDLTYVQGHVYGDRPVVMAAATAPAGVVTAATGAPVTDQASDRLIERVDGLEKEVRDLTGQVEELGNRIEQLQQQFNQFSGKPAPQAGASAPATSAVSSDPPAPGPAISGNSAQGAGAAPGETTLGQVPVDAVPNEGTYQDQYNTALGYLRQQDYKNAEAALKIFIARHGDTDLAGPAVYWLGETYYVQNDFTNAAATFLSALKKYPKSPKAPDSMLKLGMSLAALGNLDKDPAGKKLKLQQACNSFRDLPKQYPAASPTIVQRAKVESQRAKCA